MIRIHDPKRMIENAIRAMYQNDFAELLISLLPVMPDVAEVTLQKKK